MQNNKKDRRISVSKGAGGTLIVLYSIPGRYSFILYELVRAIFFLLFVRKWRQSFSVKLKRQYLSAHCLCYEFIDVWQYVIVLLMPSILLGWLPLFYGLFFRKVLFLLFGLCFLFMGWNDYKSVYLLRYFSMTAKVIEQLPENKV